MEGSVLLDPLASSGTFSCQLCPNAQTIALPEEWPVPEEAQVLLG